MEQARGTPTAFTPAVRVAPSNFSTKQARLAVRNARKHEIVSRVRRADIHIGDLLQALEQISKPEHQEHYVLAVYLSPAGTAGLKDAVASPTRTFSIVEEGRAKSLAEVLRATAKFFPA